jgi:RNA polymerase sigma-70 factor (ECF subfamily)
MAESNADTSRVLSNRGAASASDRWPLLILRIAAGDSGALSEFYDEASRYVHTIAIRILREPEEAEEITLDVFQQVWRLASSYNPDRCSVASWLGMMTRSRSLDRWRTLQTRRRFLTPETPDTSTAASSEAGPESTLAVAQQQRQIHLALSKLPEEQRIVITLAFWDGLSHAEVASRTGLPLGTVKTRIRLGMLKLKEDLDLARQ